MMFLWRACAALVATAVLAGCRGSVSAASGSVGADPHPAVITTDWYLPAHYAKAQTSVVVLGTGSALGKLYGHSSDIDVVPGATYSASATVDARYARGRVCFYLAELPSGKDLGIECAVNGKVRRYTISSFIPLNVRAVQWVAFVDGATVERDKPVLFSDPDLRAIKLPDVGGKNLLSN